MHSHDQPAPCPAPAVGGRARRAIALGLLFSGSLVANGAFAHVGVVATPARAGAPVRLALQVGHGCAESATTTLVVQVPEGLLLARPLAKPGWTISTRARTLDKPFALHGMNFGETTALIRWEGGSLPSHLADEFVFNAIVAEGASGKLLLRVQQACEDGQAFEWSGPPESAQPAPVLVVEPGAPAAAGHRH